MEVQLVSFWDAGLAEVGERALARLAQTAKLDEQSRVLEFGCASGEVSLFLARRFNCEVSAVDSDPSAVEALHQKLAMGNRAAVKARQIDPREPPFAEGDFQLIVSLRKRLLPASDVALKLRRFLAPEGRFLFGYPVTVGLRRNRLLQEFWEKRLGEPLVSSRQVLESISDAGYEPEAVETVDDAIAEAFYSAASHSTEAVQRPCSVGFALIMARRREADEKPASTRMRGRTAS